MALLINQIEGKGYIESYILKRVKQNKNFICTITGSTGSGKSFGALRLAQNLDPNFDIRNVVFDAEEFMNLVNGATKKLEKGSVILFDEIQVTMSHTDFMSLQAKLINYVLQTFRNLNFVLILTAPQFTFINKSVRLLSHARFQTEKIDYQNKQTHMKPLFLDINQKNGRIYEKYLRVITEDGPAPLSLLKLSLPSKELILAYEEKKAEFTKKLNEDIANSLKKSKFKQELIKNKDILTEEQRKIVNLLKEGKLLPEISQILGTKLPNIHKSLGFIRKKGILIKNIKEKNKVIKYEVEEK